MKRILPIIFLICCYSQADAQTSNSSIIPSTTFNKYLIKIDTTIAINTQSTNTYIKQICATNSSKYNTSTKYFEVLTTKNLEENIISGKLQKNLTPITEFIFVGQVKSSPSAATSTISAQ